MAENNLHEFPTPARSPICNSCPGCNTHSAVDCPLLIPLHAIVEAGGGRFAGIQQYGPEPLILIHTPNNTTLAVKLSNLSAESVRARIAESAAAFAKVKGATCGTL